jgi:hypothetical protein
VQATAFPFGVIIRVFARFIVVSLLALILALPFVSARRAAVLDEPFRGLAEQPLLVSQAYPFTSTLRAFPVFILA